MSNGLIETVCVAIDNSTFSEACTDAAVSLAGAFGAEIVGAHVYAARMHERRFRQLEASLPEEYLDDQELERQRAVHESLISLGLQLISDSYLDELERRCKETEVPFSRKTFDGRNWEQLSEHINASHYDLLVMGARGHGTTRSDATGSVCLRVLRRTQTDSLIIKEPEAFRNGAGRNILVALDGSPEAYGGLRLAIALGKAYGRTVEAIAAYDPYFHYAVFNSMVEVLSPDAAQLFKFEEQERLHEEIIDSGLARLYQTHLEVAERIAAEEGVELKSTLLSGRAADEVLAYAEKARPWLVVLGRRGVHSDPDMDIGGVTEHMLRFATMNLLVASRGYTPPLEMWGQATVRWTEEAETVLGRAPEEHHGVIRLMVHRLASEEGHTVATASLVREAMSGLRPRPDSMKQMGAAAMSVAAQALKNEPSSIYLCPRCGHAARRERPVKCSVCQNPGDSFLTITPEEVEATLQRQGGSKTEETFDGRSLRWTASALESLDTAADGEESRRARLRVEKAARLAKIPVVTEEFVLGHLSGRAKPATNADMAAFSAATPDDDTKMRPGHSGEMNMSQENPLDWTPDAEARLLQVPDSPMRELTRLRVERLARQSGQSTVTVELMDAKYQVWAEGSAKVKSEMAWTHEATERMDRVPPFVRGMAVEAIEEYARKQGAREITPEILEQAMGHWGEMGQFHQH